MSRPSLYGNLFHKFHTASVSVTTSRWFKRLIPLPVTLVLGLVIRIGYVGGYGHTDISIWSRWIGLIQQHGLFSFYAQHDPAHNYPPLAIIGFGILAAFPWLGPAYPDRYDPGYLTNLKILPIVCDLLIITISYWWLRG